MRFICNFWGASSCVFVAIHRVLKNKCDLFLYFSRFALPFNKVGCTREYKTKLRICFDIPLICTTFAAVECVFAYRCLFPYLQHICSTLTQMACLITVCISRRLSKFDKQAINKENPCSSLSYTDFFCRLCLIWIIKDIDQVVYFLFIQKIILHFLLPDLNGIQRQVLMQGCWDRKSVV